MPVLVFRWLVLILLACAVTPRVAHAAESLPSLVRILGSATDTQLQLDILRGLRDATQGRPTLPMPAGWEPTEAKLVQSEVAEIRALATSLGLTFGSPTALASLRSTLRDPNAAPTQRQDALRSLLVVRDTSLPATLRELLRDPSLRGAAARGLITFDDAATAPALLDAYASLAGGEKRDALTTLASRPAYARALLEAVSRNVVPPRDLTAEVVRQLRNLKDESINASLTQVYGTFRDVPADKVAEIERYKRIFRAGGSTPGDAIRGRTVYAKVCQQCHSLFDIGGKVGPDLTGSNRGDLDYLLQNIVDPNAVIPNEYRASTLELKDGRVVTGILKQQDDRSVVVAAANETVRIPRGDITETTESQLSMMPEGLLAPLADQEYRDLIYYLSRPSQSPMLATPDTANLFFNGLDLSFWQGDESTWNVAYGEIHAKSGTVQPGNRSLRSDLVAGDFRLLANVRFPESGSGGSISFRAEPTPDGGVRGYSLSLVPATWGNLSEEGGRGGLVKVGQPAWLRRGDWNLVEILAQGIRIRIAVNGRQLMDIEDATGARQGIFALQLPSSGPAEIHFKGLQLEAHPTPELTTLRE